ncbi:MAG: glycosyltransferase family 1 protein [Thermomicrobiaceae bacterium]
MLIDGRLIGYRHGGIASYARQLAAHAPGMAGGLDIRLAIRKPVGNLLDRSVKAFTPPHHRYERYLFGMEVYIRGPNLLHSVDYVHPISPEVASVVTVHDLAFLANPSLLARDSLNYYRQVIETLPHADRVIAVSEWTRRQILDSLEIDPERIRVVPNGFDSSLIGTSDNNDTARLARLHPLLGSVLDSERPILLAVGTIEPRKRFDILVRAFECHSEIIKDRTGTSPVLVIAGQAGWLSDSVVRALRNLQRSGNAIWLRDVNDRELAALYRVAKLLAMPSADEGFGLPVLEAMASGTASLVAEVGALPGLVGDCGFIESSAEPGEWAEKIGRILADSEILGRRSRKGIKRASPFTWKETARQTVDVYREVLDER